MTTNIDGARMWVLRELMIRRAAELLDQSPGQPEYLRGMTELIVRTTLAINEDAETVRDEVAARIDALNAAALA